MKKLKIFTYLFCSFLVFVTLLFLIVLGVHFYNSFGPVIVPIWFIGTYVLTIVVHDYICMSIICSVRKKLNICDECYFWNCPHFSVCPYNTNK